MLKHAKNRWLLAFAVCSICVFVLLCQNLRSGTLWALPADRTVKGVAKSETVMDDDDKSGAVGTMANVLFLLDTGSAMAFSPNGKLPEMINIPPDNPLARRPETLKRRQELAARMLKECTYGDGSIPIRYDGNSIRNGSRYGRDIDSSNNWKPGDTWDMHLDDYYSPFEEYPYALVFRNTKHWKSPPANSGNNYSADHQKGNLVPNDSRMYKMKLVMWRLLNDASLFENLRIGMATTFQEQNSLDGNYVADFYKSYPFGVQRSKYGLNVPFDYGAGPIWSTGLGASDKKESGSVYNQEGGYWTVNTSVGYNDSSACFWGIDRKFYDITDHKAAEWILVNRAYLRVPIADYSKSLSNFRLWINGFEDITLGKPGKDPYRYKDPELMADGKTYLSTAIYPGHPDLSRQVLAEFKNSRNPSGIMFSSTENNVRVYASSKGSSLPKTFNELVKGTGEVLGTVLDFFSPPVKGIGGVNFSAGNVETAPRVSFPLKDPCETNWLIIFTAGDDSSTYSSAAAVKDLYEYTKNNPLTQLAEVDNGRNKFKEIKLDDGVRTLVVGFVPPEGGGKDTQLLRDRLTKMAKAGDPGNPNAKAYFANDVPSLIAALRELIGRIQTESRPAKGPMGESSRLDMTDPSGSFNIFQAQYQVFDRDQWQGILKRYVVSMNKEGQVATTFKWELGEELLKNRTKRKLVYWNGRSFAPLKYTASDTDSSEHPQAELMGLDSANLTGYAGGSRLHPSRAMINWLYGYDFSYSESGVNRHERVYMLSDLGQSGTVLAGAPSTKPTNLKGYNEWAYSQKDRQVRLFAQSNDGVLHVIDPLAESAGSLEQLAIVPPPVLQPFRLSSLKFFIDKDASGTELKAKWLNNGDGFSSVPSYILDGRLVKRDFAFSGDRWGTYLFGMLGKAGNGLYAMDISAPDAPKFLWYRETQYENGSPVVISMGPGDAKPTYSKDTNNSANVSAGSSSVVFSTGADRYKYPFYQLGYNSPAVAAGVADIRTSDKHAYKNFLVLGGGMQEELDLQNNGYVGAAIYILDPETAYKNGSESGTMTFNSRSDIFYDGDGRTWHAGSGNVGANPYMGMITSPPYLVRTAYNRWLTGKIYTADNRGNIFEIETESSDPESGAASPLQPRDWRLRTIAALRNESEKAADDNHNIPHGVLVASTSQSYGSFYWIAGATANASTRGFDGTESSAMIRNKGQHLFTFRVSSEKGSAQSGRGTVYRSDLQKLTHDYSGSAEDKHDPSNAQSRGWYIELNPERPTLGEDEEYATARPELMGNTLFFATFTPIAASLTGCDGQVKGYSRLYALDAATGLPSWGLAGPDFNRRNIILEGIKITGFTLSRQGMTETLFITYAAVDKGLADTSLSFWEAKGLINKVGDMSAFTIPRRTGRFDTLKPMSTYINYWKESY